MSNNEYTSLTSPLLCFNSLSPTPKKLYPKLLPECLVSLVHAPRPWVEGIIPEKCVASLPDASHVQRHLATTVNIQYPSIRAEQCMTVSASPMALAHAFVSSPRSSTWSTCKGEFLKKRLAKARRSHHTSPAQVCAHQAISVRSVSLRYISPARRVSIG
jgi:hypothetical protein